MNEDFLTREQIRLFAREILNDLPPEALDSPYVVVHALQPAQICKRMGLKQNDIPEISTALRRIREAVFEELCILKPEKYKLLHDNFVDGKNRQAELTGNTILKQGFFSGERLVHATDDSGEKRQKGEKFKEQAELIKKLYQLKDRSEYIAYLNLHSEANGEGVVEINRKLENFETLQDIIRNPDKKPSFMAALGFVRDAMRGNLFLIQHQLILIDNALDNILVSNGRGQLFDMDGLRKLNTLTDEDIAKREMIPPEAVDDDLGPWWASAGLFILGEKYVVFELGKTLYKLGEDYHDSLPEISKLISEMTARKPKKRMSLKSAISALEEIIDKLSGKEPTPKRHLF